MGRFTATGQSHRLATRVDPAARRRRVPDQLKLQWKGGFDNRLSAIIPICRVRPKWSGHID